MVDLGDAFRKLQQAAKAAVPEAAVGARAPLIEIFHSIQGEGRFVGVPMAFLRVATCPIRCLYCDTPDSYQAPSRFPVRTAARDSQEPNPCTASRAAELVASVTAAAGTTAKVRRVSVTGGEPLVFPAFVAEFGRLVRDRGFRLHLETAALDPAALQQCIAQVDHLSADYKLPETLAAGSHGPQHVQCCEIALRAGKTVDVKIVLTDRVTDPGVERALQDLAPLRDKILLVLQPATPFGACTKSVARVDLERFAAMAARMGFDFRVLPQVHKQLQVR